LGTAAAVRRLGRRFRGRPFWRRPASEGAHFYLGVDGVARRRHQSGPRPAWALLQSLSGLCRFRSPPRRPLSTREWGGHGRLRPSHGRRPPRHSRCTVVESMMMDALPLDTVTTRGVDRRRYGRAALSVTQVAEAAAGTVGTVGCRPPCACPRRALPPPPRRRRGPVRPRAVRRPCPFAPPMETLSQAQRLRLPLLRGTERLTAPFGGCGCAAPAPPAAPCRRPPRRQRTRLLLPLSLPRGRRPGGARIPLIPLLVIPPTPNAESSGRLATVRFGRAPASSPRPQPPRPWRCTCVGGDRATARPRSGAAARVGAPPLRPRRLCPRVRQEAASAPPRWSAAAGAPAPRP